MHSGEHFHDQGDWPVQDVWGDDHHGHGTHYRMPDDPHHVHPGVFYDHMGWAVPTLGFDKFDPGHADYQHIVGDPNDLAVWHHQTLPDDCAIATQNFILDEITGQHHSEAQCVEVAKATGGYIHGTTPDHAGDLLNAYGIATQGHYGATLDEIRNQLAQHHKVMIAIDSSMLAGVPGGIPGHHANHAVQVAFVDDSDPTHPKIVLNDPGCANGQGMIVPSEKFYEVWGPGGNFLLHTEDGSLSRPVLPPPQYFVATLAGYERADGLYHYSSDNTNRDPNGHIISYGN